MEQVPAETVSAEAVNINLISLIIPIIPIAYYIKYEIAKMRIIIMYLIRVMVAIGSVLTFVGTLTDNKKMVYIGGGITLTCPFIEYIVSQLKKETIDRSRVHSLVERINVIKDILRKKKEEGGNLGEEYNETLIMFNRVSIKIKSFIETISQSNKYQKFIMAQEIDNTYKELCQEYDDCIKSLQLSIQMSTYINAEKSKRLLEDEFQDTLERIGSVVINNNEQTNTVLQEVVIIKNKLGNVNSGQDSTISRIIRPDQEN